ncbi:MAG: hypothetical protein ABIP94_21025 [Planctomycetota bacterium]
MQAKIGFVLVAAVLVGALVSGNPFLAPRAIVAPVEGAPVEGAPVAVVLVNVVPMGAVTPATSRAGKAMGAVASDAALQRAFLQDALERSSSSDGPGSVRAGPTAPLDGVTCPDRSLRPLVVEVRTDRDGAPVWVLRDGRVLRRNPLTGEGQPVLVPLANRCEPAEKGIAPAH